jgi:hypothetical protein
MDFFAILPIEIISYLLTFIPKEYHNFLRFVCRNWAIVILPTNIPNQKSVQYVAKSGNLDLLIWASEKGYYPTTKLLSKALKGGHLDIINYIYSKTRNCPFFAYSKIAKHSRIDLLEWVKSKSKQPDQESFYNYLCKGGFIGGIKWFLEQGCQLNDRVFLNAVKSGNLDILKWIYREYPTLSKTNLQISIWAVYRDHLDVLEWLKISNFTIDYTTVISAIKYGRLKILKWLFAQNYHHLIPSSVDPIGYANDHIEIIKWLQEQGYQLNPNILSTHIEINHLSTLIWLFENGCKLPKKLYKRPIENEDIEILNWLLENGCPFDENLLYFNNESNIVNLWYMSKFHFGNIL